MSIQIGISCDSCLKTNFAGRRYKCLLCDNYDLCGTCYDTNCESENHLHTHPMQCVLTKTLYELFYSGETISYRTVVSLTCPYCGQSGFVLHTLRIHCLENHSNITSDNKTNQIIMCPICVVNSSQDRQTRFVSLVDHITKEHDDENSLIINQIKRLEDRKENFDHYDDEGLPLYILAERLFSKDENRRQRLAQTLIRNHYNSTFNGNTNSQRRTNSIIRNSHHFNNYPYVTMSRPTTTESFRGSYETTMENDPYSAVIFSNDSLFDFDHSITQTPFFLTSMAPMHLPSTDMTMTNERINQKRSILSNNKQKRFNPIQQTILLNETSNSDNRNYQRNPISTSIDIIKSPLNDTRSLLGKILTSNDNTKIHSKQDHLAFLHSLFLSSMSIK